MPRGTGRCLLALLFTLLLGCGGSNPAPSDTVSILSPEATAEHVDVATTEPVDNGASAPSRRMPGPDAEAGDEEFHESDSALTVAARLEALLAQDSRLALRRAVRLLLEQRGLGQDRKSVV